MAISIEDIELRRELRAPQGVPANYSLETGSQQRKAELVDVASGGAGLLCDHPLSLNQRLHLNGRQARVRWVKKQQDGFRLGLAFETAA